MKTLIVVLALCVLTCAKSCPKSSEITQEDINSVNTVALVTVTDSEYGNHYYLHYVKYFDVRLFLSTFEILI
ncbi:hypothetical protein Y032_0017g3330 [Ancylostoma ceylanicum]|uniref:Cystatin domain-containing protein n=1 Tax=Ancylostoma ceylanicum TaxID=53326 RepID=A0A016V567_9BILA|nr:hypothetical protein Y032_0017g3330 [Ancylostoma ceylanicum]